MKDLGRKIQKFTIILTIIEYVGEAIWFVYSLNNFIKYNDFIDFKYIASEYTILAQQGLVGIFRALICAVITTIFFFGFYGFGQLVSDVHIISKK